MKFLDLIIKQAANDPEYLEGFSTVVLTGFMTIMVIAMIF